jgi:hypothetical protein
MFYQLDDLLIRMGAPEAREKNHIEWHYFDQARSDLAGYAEVRIEAGGKFVIAEMKRTRDNYEDDHGNILDSFTETFSMRAERVAGDHYKIVRLAFDGTTYENPEKNIVTLGLGLFHARALDTSILMVEQAFNKQDMFEPRAEAEERFRKAIFSAVDAAPRQNFGVVIPFRPRGERRAANG